MFSFDEGENETFLFSEGKQKLSFIFPRRQMKAFLHFPPGVNRHFPP